jgi:hypothetical protein
MTDNKTNIKKADSSKVYNLKTAMLEFQKLSISARKDGKNPHFKSNYATLEAVIEAVNQGNQFGLYFTQEIAYIKSDLESTPIPLVRTTVHQINDDNTYVSECPIILQPASLQNPQKLGAAITYYKRYTLQSVYGLPSEDDDGNLASKPSIQTGNSKSSQGEYDDGL